MKKSRIHQVDPRSLDDIHAALHDRRALRAPSGGTEYISPEPGRESDIASIWSEVLGRSRIGRHDDFFHLGGNSIQAVQVLSLLRTQFGIEVPFSSIFDAPVLHAFAARSLSSEREAASVPSILVRAARGEPFPLSPAQERIWFLSKLGDDSAYNIPLKLRLKGEVQPHALQTALQRLVERHESLRTSFIEIDAQPHQVVHDEVNLELELRDFRATPSDWVTYARREAARRFDLSAPPLLRAQLLILADAEHVLLVTMHHIVSDAWSIGIVVKDVAQLYASSVAGEVLSHYSPLLLQLPDVAVWQRQRLASGALESDRNYWRKALSGAPAVLELPSDRPRPRVMPPKGDQLEVVLEASLASRLSTLAIGHGATLFMVLLAAFKILLYRYTGATDLSIGTPVAGRDRTELEDIVGFLANTIVLRTRMQPDQSFADYLIRVKTTVVEGLTHQAVPFEQIVQDLAPHRSQAYSPLFQTMFILQNVPHSQIEIPGIEIQPLPVHTGSSKFDLTCSIHERAGRLHVSFEYSTALFEHSTIARLAKHYEVLLEGICANPSLEVQSLPLLTKKEEQQILEEWNDTVADYPQDTVHQLFELQVLRNPTLTAVVYEGERLTYGELNAQANQLARQLRSLGVGSEVLVGICVERSLEMVLGILAVLKAGGAYLPLDPNYPSERLAYILEDASPKVLLTQERLLTQLPQCKAKVLSLNQDRSLWADQSVENLANLVGPDTLAYVIYTSGSTGRPKGVENTHRGLCNRLSWFLSRFNLERPVTALKTGIGFVDSVTETLGTLLGGGRLIVLDKQEGRDPVQLVQAINHHEVTQLVVVPSLLRELLALRDLRLDTLKLLISSGENLPKDLALEARARLPNTMLLNLYGSSEVNGDSTFFVCSTPKLGSAIGRPISNTQIYILNTLLQPQPVGIAGELHIGGAGLARGYLNRPELTASKFIANPFDESGSRLYKTGDLAKYLPDGNIEYLGRIDDQVKLRGFRIELGEVECVLQEHPSVAGVAVVLVDTLAGKYLAGFVVRQDECLSANSLRDEVMSLARTRLPDYMVPTVLHVVAEIPLTPNGKVDRATLVTLAASSLPRNDVALEPAATMTEQSVCALVAELVGRERVSPSNNFFEVGGHSLLGIRLLARINDEFRVHISVRELFDHPTPRQLSALVDRQRMLQLLTQVGPMDQPGDVEEF